MTDAVEAMVEAEMIIEATGENAAIAMTTVATLLVELIAIAGMTDTDVVEMSDEEVATMTVTTEVVTVMVAVMVADLVKLPPLVVMVTQLLAERAGNHMPEVEETLMKDPVVDTDR